MANNRINRYIGAFALGTVLMAVPGCTDTWDDHYDSGLASETTVTLWERIKSNPDYSRFADIAQRAKYYKDNTHAVPDYSYADILDGGQVNTVWVPDNSALTQAEYEKWLQKLESGSAADGFSVQQQFLGNHIALWRHNISEPGIDTVRMINGKNLSFDKYVRTLQGIPLAQGASGVAYNIPAVNGTMHVLKGITPFHYNFYEYLKYGEPQTKLGKYVVRKDTTYFSAANSIEGLPDENGNPTYVDSVYYTSNRLFGTKRYLPSIGAENWQMYEEGFGENINEEDSVFIMLLPTDVAWDAAFEKLKASHTYATTYEDKTKGDLGMSKSATTIKGLDSDSLQKMSIEMDMVSPLVFNLHKQPKRGGSEVWTLDMFKTFKGDGGDPQNPNNYLLNTFGDTLRAVGDWKPSDLFNVEATEMSNGLAYEVTSWDFPMEFYTPDVEVEIENTSVFYNKDSNTSKYKVGNNSKRYTFSNDNYRDITDKYGKVSNSNFYHLDASGPTAPPKLEIKLLGNSPSAYVPYAEVMSGKYDVQLVVVPHWYLDIANGSGIEDKIIKRAMEYIYDEDGYIIDYKITREVDEHVIDSLAAINKYKFRTQISYNNNAANDKTSSWVTSTYDGLKVDTITVVEDFEFPYSYKNMRFSYPTLTFEGQTSKNDAKNGYVYDIVIDKIILKRKD